MPSIPHTPRIRHGLLPLLMVATCLAANLPAAGDTLAITREIEFDRRSYFNGEGSGGQDITNSTEVYRFVDTSSVIVPAGTYDRIELVLTVAPGNRFVIDPTPAVPELELDILWQAPGQTGGGISGTVDLAYTNGSPNLPTTGQGGLTFGGTGGLIFITASQDDILLPVDGATFESVTIGQSGPATVIASETEFDFKRAEVRFLYGTLGDLGPDPGPFTSIVPEPSSFALLGLGGLVLSRLRRRSWSNQTEHTPGPSGKQR